MRTAIVMMTKLPIPGFCKNRLHEVLDVHESAEFQRRCIKDLAALIRESGLPLYIHYASPGEYEPAEKLGDVPYIPQKGGDLGERMYHAVQQTLLDYAAVIVIGSDLPDLGSGVLQQVVTELEHSDLVLGPCRDGGYYLLGTKRGHPEVFRGISWSSPLVLEQTLKKSEQAGLSDCLLETRQDIDTWSDLVDYYYRNQGVSKSAAYAYAERLVTKYLPAIMAPDINK